MPAMESLNLNGESLVAPSLPIPPAETDRKNPTLAWLLSFFCPGAGQLYCRNEGRGLVTIIVFWIAFIVAFTVKPPAPAWGIAVRYAMALWCFATLDAFFWCSRDQCGCSVPARRSQSSGRCHPQSDYQGLGILLSRQKAAGYCHLPLAAGGGRLVPNSKRSDTTLGCRRRRAGDDHTMRTWVLTRAGSVEESSSSRCAITG